MTLVNDIAIAMLLATVVLVGRRMLLGPSDADRAVASDLLFFTVIALFALFGVLLHADLVLDVVLVATTVGFLASLSLARAVTRGRR